jgi:hypothetical protein
MGLLGGLAVPKATAGSTFLRVLNELGSGRGPARAANPMNDPDRVGGDRRVRFLVGETDPLVEPVLRARPRLPRHAARRLGEMTCGCPRGRPTATSLGKPLMNNPADE